MLRLGQEVIPGHQYPATLSNGTEKRLDDSVDIVSSILR